jgi:ThiF family
MNGTKTGTAMSGPAAPDRRLRVVSGSEADGHAVLELLDNTMIKVILPDGTPHWRHQVLAVTLVNLLARLFPWIEINCDPTAVADPMLPPGKPLLTDRLAAAARSGGLSARGRGAAPSITVVIGTGCLPPAAVGFVLFVDGGGWQSYNGTVSSRLPAGPWPDVPIGPLAAACRAASQATAAALAPLSTVRTLEPSVYSSALTFDTGSDPVDEGPDGRADAWHDPVIDAVIAGAGSIGGAAAYTFGLTPGLAGDLGVTDPQRLEGKNLDRAILATAATTAAHQWKADAAKDALEHHARLLVTAHRSTLADWVAGRPANSPLPLVLCAVDSGQARRAVQDCLPFDLVNAACHPEEITVSGHRTGDGPCVCCLHMEQVLDARTIKIRLLAAATGLNERMITEYLVQGTPLSVQVIRQIERHRCMQTGALQRYENLTLDDLRAGELLYGATVVTTDSGSVAVAAPYVTALAGVLLASEALKAAVPALRVHRLGPHGLHVKYEENRHAGPLHSLLTTPARWSGSECLCRSTRRLRLLADRYGTAGL